MRARDRAYANVIGHDIVSKWCPLAWEAFLDYRLRALTFSRLELEVLAALQGGKEEQAAQLAASHGLLTRGPDGKLVRSREREEMEAKLETIGLIPPWRNEDPTSS